MDNIGKHIAHTDLIKYTERIGMIHIDLGLPPQPIRRVINLLPHLQLKRHRRRAVHRVIMDIKVKVLEFARLQGALVQDPCLAAACGDGGVPTNDVVTEHVGPLGD